MEGFMYYPRTIEKIILETVQAYPCIVIYGPRQVGKSTTLRVLFGEKMRYLSLDDVQDRTLAIENPKLFLDTNHWPLMIDEIQKAPGLLSEIKKRIDDEKFRCLSQNQKPSLMYLLTGSNQFELQEAVVESLAGRTAIFQMSSFTRVEKNKRQGSVFNPDIQILLTKEKQLNPTPRTRIEIFEEILEGGMPEIIAKGISREIYYRNYLSTYIEKDVKKLISATSESTFLNFINYIALRTGQQLELDDISKSVGANVKTCRRWLSILETSGIIVLLQPYLKNASNRITKTPKLYFLDTGLCAYLCKWPTAEMLEKSAMAGAFYETYVVSEILKSFYNAGLDPKSSLFFYRDKDQKEVDLLYLQNGFLIPIEIKKGIQPEKANKNFSVLSKYGLEIKPGLIIDSTDRIRPINENAYYCPMTLVGL